MIGSKSGVIFFFLLLILSSCEKDINVETKNKGHFLSLFHLVTEDGMTLTNYNINVYYSNDSYVNKTPDFQRFSVSRDRQFIIPFENPNFWVEFYYSNEDGNVAKLNSEDKFSKPEKIPEGALTEYDVLSFRPKIRLTYFERTRSHHEYTFSVLNDEYELLWERKFVDGDTVGRYPLNIPYIFLDEKLIIRYSRYDVKVEYYEPYKYVNDTVYSFDSGGYGKYVFGQNIKME